VLAQQRILIAQVPIISLIGSDTAHQDHFLPLGLLLALIRALDCSLRTALVLIGGGGPTHIVCTNSGNNFIIHA